MVLRRLALAGALSLGTASATVAGPVYAPITFPVADGTVLPTVSGGGVSITGPNRFEIDRTSTGNYIDSNFDTVFPAGVQVIANCGLAGLGGCVAGPVTIRFNAAVSNFQIYADDFDTFPNAYTFTATAFDGVKAIDTLTATSRANNAESPALLSLFSSEPITSLTLSDAPVDPSVTPFNDFVFTLAYVPEPATLAVLGVGVAGLVGARRRRRG